MWLRSWRTAWKCSNLCWFFISITNSMNFNADFIRAYLSSPRGITYPMVANASPSLFEAHVGLFRLFMKGIFGPYIMWPFDKKQIFELVTRIRTLTSSCFQLNWHCTARLYKKLETLRKFVNLIKMYRSIKLMLIADTGIPQLVLFVGPQVTALFEKPH